MLILQSLQWYLEGPAPDGSGGLGVIVVSERYKLQLDMSQSAGFSAVLHSPGIGVRASTASAEYSWMLLPVRTDYWNMINTARGLLVKKQTLHARVGFMNWGQITTMHRSDLVQYIRARGMRQIVVMGPFSGSPWLGMYSQFLYEPSQTLEPPYTNESYDTEMRVEACDILHSIQADVGGPIECLAPFETALTPDLPPGSLIPRFRGGSLSRTVTAAPTIMNNWGPCQASDDPSPACKDFVATHGRSYVYVLETNGSTDEGRGEYLAFVMSKFRPLLARGYSGAYFDLFSYAYGEGWQTSDPGRLRYTFDRWDGFSVDLTANFTIARKKADLCLWTAQARAQLINDIISRSSQPPLLGPSIVVNDMGVADAVRALPIHHFLEAVLPQGYSQTHLSTPIVLGWTPGYSVGSAEDDKSGNWWKNWTHASNAVRYISICAPAL